MTTIIQPPVAMPPIAENQIPLPDYVVENGMLFSKQIPAKLQGNPIVARFVRILDGLMVDELASDMTISIPNFYGKTVEMQNTKKSFDPIRMERFNFYHFMLYEMGKIDWVNGFPKEVLERLAINGYNIMAKKGSEEGLKLLAKSLWLGDIALKPEGFLTALYIIPDDIPMCGYLPDGNDLNLLYTREREFLYLYNGEGEYYNRFIEIRMISPFFYMEQFRQFVATVMKKYLPMFDQNNTGFIFKFYNLGFIGKYLYYGDNPSEETVFVPVPLISETKGFVGNII